MIKAISIGLMQHIRRRSERGTALVETGIMLPFLLLLLCGAMDMARAFHHASVVVSAARAGLQYATFGLDRSGQVTNREAAARADASNQGVSVAISSRTFCMCASGTDPNTQTVDCTDPDVCGGAVPGGFVETTASHTFVPLFPYPGIPPSIAITSRSRMRVQ